MSVINAIKTVLKQLKGNDLLTIDEKYEAIKEFLPSSCDIFASQEGEDILVKRLLKKYYTDEKGYYVDIGAYDPVKFSNTFHFYLKGWRGINIDPNEQAIKNFNFLRPRDINLHCGISDKASKLEYYSFTEGAFNTFSKEQAEIVKNNAKTEFIGVSEVDVLPLYEILDSNLPDYVDITLMNIDVEGFELNVLKSNNWDKYRPMVILIEALNENKHEEIEAFLNEEGYIEIAKLKNTNVFVEKSKYEKLENNEDIEFNGLKEEKTIEVKVDKEELFFGTLIHLQQEIEQLRLNEKQTILNQRIHQLNQKNQELEQKQKVIEQKNNELKEKNQELEQKQKVIEQKNNELKEKNQELEQKQKVIEQKNNELKEKNQELEQKQKVIEQKNNELKEKNQELEQKQKVNNKLSKELHAIYLKLEQKNKDITFLSNVKNQKDNKIYELNSKVSEQQKVINKQAQELVKIYKSKKYKVAHKLAASYVIMKNKVKGN